MNTPKPQYNLTFIWLICLVAAVGGFLFGYDWVVVGGAKPFYEPYFDLTTPGQKGWGTSSALIGCIIGAFLCILLADRFGRKRLLILSGALFTFSALATSLSGSFPMFNLFRIIGGIGIGITLNLSPMYISEMSPPHIRGKMVSLNQLLIMFGILSAQIINWRISLVDSSMPVDASAEVIRESWNGQMGWRWMFGVETVPAFLFLLFMIFMPESVRWLVKNGQADKAERILSRVGGEAYAKSEIRSIGQSVEGDVARVDFSKLLEPGLVRILLLGIFLAILQQWCGMNVIFYYAADIFQAAGYNIREMMLQIVVIGTIMVLSVFLTIMIVDKVGRKFLMLSGTAALAVIYIIEGFLFRAGVQGWPIVVLTLASVAVYSITLAPVMWVILSEIFPNRIRGAAMSIAALSLWVGNFSLTFTFPTIKENLGWSMNFWLYALICGIGFFVLFFKLPETKGKTLEEIEEILIR